MTTYNQGEFRPKNPGKYVGTYPITFRSSWELTFMNVCDRHPNILEWASENLKIPYQDPTDGRMRTYIPDFYIVYVDVNDVKHAEVIEIKPMSQSVSEAARSRKDMAAVQLNEAKWKAAYAWCSHHGLRFRIMTEQQLYAQAGRR